MRNSQVAGSPNSGEPVFLVIGHLRRPHGVRGEILMKVLTDFPERIQVDSTVYVGPEFKPHRIRARRPHLDNLLIAFVGYTNREDVGALRNCRVYVRSDTLPDLPQGEYYHHQLIGLRVLTDEGQLLGTLTEILETGANDVYVVRPQSGKDILLPAIDPVIRSVDLEKGQIYVSLLDGLL